MPDATPTISERDARLLCGKITEAVKRLGVLPTQIGLDLDRPGFWFTAVINGKTVSARTGQGNFRYEDIAKELVLASVDPGWDQLTVHP